VHYARSLTSQPHQGYRETAFGRSFSFARIGMLKALNRHVERVFNPDRKEHHWGRRKLARDRMRVFGRGVRAI
jgi:hypothetical protein